MARGVQDVEIQQGEGWMKFYGEGRIEGQIAGQIDDIDFRGQRSLGQGTRSDVEVAEMRCEWNGYGEELLEQYDYETKARTGRW